MLDMGFIPDIERICKLVPFTRQTLFFSATMPPEIQRLADAVPAQPDRRSRLRARRRPRRPSRRRWSTPGSEPADKRETLRDLIRARREPQERDHLLQSQDARSRSCTARCVRHGFTAGALHGDMDQRSRMAALESFRNGEMTLLVATDVAARGLDIPDVSHVFNFDVPIHAEDYVHRIGRTGPRGPRRLGRSRSLRPATRNTSRPSKALTGHADRLDGRSSARRRPERRGTPAAAAIAAATTQDASSAAAGRTAHARSRQEPASQATGQAEECPPRTRAARARPPGARPGGDAGRHPPAAAAHRRARAGLAAAADRAAPRPAARRSRA